MIAGVLQWGREKSIYKVKVAKIVGLKRPFTKDKQ